MRVANHKKSTHKGCSFCGRSGGIPPQPQSARLPLPGSPLVSADSLEALSPDGDCPTGAPLLSLPHGLTGRGCQSAHANNQNRDTLKGIPVLLVEVAGFEPAAFWSRTKRATKLRYTSKKNGADKGTRTLDLMITNQPLYHLSYIGTRAYCQRKRL